MESWIDWQKRSMSKAGEVIIKTQTSVVDLLTQERNNWCEHVARMGTETRPQHVLKAVLMHRPTAWWKQQQICNKVCKDPILGQKWVTFVSENFN